MAALMPQAGNVYSVNPDVQRKVVDLYASTGNYLHVAETFDLHIETVRRIIKSPQGSFALEQLLRERARTRALRLGATTDRLIDELDAILDRGDERILNGRRDGDPLTVFLRPGLRDVVSGLAWSTHHMREISETLSAIDVTAHDVSHESRSQNLSTLKELVALEERRLALDNERQAADAPPVDVANDVSPWSRPRWGKTQRSRAVASTGDGDTGVPGLCSSDADAPASMSAPDAEATLMHASTTEAPAPPSDNRPCPVPPAREAATETSPVLGDSRGSSREVTWEDLEEE
jgi:hypothetical protein